MQCNSIFPITCLFLCSFYLFIDSDEKTIRFQGAYVKELISLTDYPSFDVDAVCELFLLWEQHKHDDIMGYRNNAYRYAPIFRILFGIFRIFGNFLIPMLLKDCKRLLVPISAKQHLITLTMTYV